jgi:hypothetical protein
MAEDAIRTALFLDFDNVYGALFEIDPDKADLFGRRPETWLRFFAEGRHDGRLEDEALPADDTTAAGGLAGAARGTPRRAILMRNCYLNPDGRIQGERGSPQFYQYRRNFVSAGFSVIDCPNLTSRGKNAADIRMALDIVDAIDHATRFDEFIVLAVDSDMTPVLVRLRAHDRRSTVFATKMMSPAYRAACDLLVGEIDFINRALGFVQVLGAGRQVDRIAPLRQEEPTDLLQHISGEVAAYVRGRGGIPIRQALPVLNRFPSFTRPTDGKRWFGYPSMAALFGELARREAAIKLARNKEGDLLISVDAPMPMAGQAEETPPAVTAEVELQRRVMAVALRALTEQPGGILLSQLGLIIRREMPELPPKRWPGGGQLQDMLRRANDPRIALQERDGQMMAILLNPAAAAAALEPAPATSPYAEPGINVPELEAGRPIKSEIPVLPDQTALDELVADDLRSRLVSYIRGILSNEDEPIEISELERLVLAQHEIGGWPGAANFAEFLQHQQIDVLPVATGFVYDRQRQDPFAIVVRNGDGIDALSAPCRALMDLVTRNTRCPALTPSCYRNLFGAISMTLADDEQFARAGREPAVLARAIDEVEAECRKMGIAVSPDDIAYVVDALRDNDSVIGGTGEDAVLALADAYTEYLQALCADNRLVLTDEERTLLRLWIGADEIDEDGE